MTKILFICLGNICRSPMAEFVMKDLVEKAGLADEFQIDSAATCRDEIGNPVYPPARRKLAEHGISCEGHAARQLTAQDYEEYDLLIGMEGLGKVVNFGALSTYFLLNLCVVVWFWFRKKDHGNPVRFLVCPILGMIVVFALLLSLDVPAKIIGVVWIAIGIVYYLVMTHALHREITME